MPPAINEEQNIDQRELAPRWHTVALILLIVAVAVVGTLTKSSPTAEKPAPSTRLGVYLTMAIVPWMLTAYVARLGRRRSALRSLLGDSPRVFDALLAVPVALAIRTCEWFVARGDATRAHAIAEMLPRSTAERTAWLVVAASVGFGEEVVYRGYLKTQLSAFTGSRAVGLASQALLFGVAHLNQGPASAARVAVYGALLGLVVEWRKSLWPAIFAHVAIDAMPALGG